MLSEIRVIVPGLSTAGSILPEQRKVFDYQIDMEGIHNFWAPDVQMSLLESSLHLWGKWKEGKTILLWGETEKAALIAVMILSHDLTPDLALRQVRNVLGNNILSKLPALKETNHA